MNWNLEGDLINTYKHGYQLLMRLDLLQPNIEYTYILNAYTAIETEILL